ncbi:MAG: response regulator [Deltaproteobacteria bacterium]|nr:response regulator [Deltaproteobacteria bacterium]
MIGFKVLLVDDEVVFTENMSSLLTTRGYQVTAVNNGESAIRALEEKDFDVVVLDLKMPGMDGMATLKEIKKLGLFTEILILTGHGAIDTAMEAVKLGAYDYLTKPCDIDELTDKIEEARTKKDNGERKELNNKIKKVVESPKAAFSLFKRKK